MLLPGAGASGLSASAIGGILGALVLGGGVIVDNEGNWQIPFRDLDLTRLIDGPQVIGLTITDAAGNSSSTTVTLNVALNQTLLAYLQVKRYQTLSASAERHITSLEAVKATAQMRAQAGLNSQSDVLQAETRIAGTVATLAQYRAQQRSALAQLTVLTGVVPASLPDLPQTLLQQEVTL